MMAGTRPSLFEDDEIDLSSFSPKTSPDPAPVPHDTVRKVSEQGGFPSRAPRGGALDAAHSDTSSETVNQPSSKRLPLVYRTGRNVTFSAKATQATVDTFYEIARAQGWKGAETLEHAIKALKEKLS